LLFNFCIAGSQPRQIERSSTKSSTSNSRAVKVYASDSCIPPGQTVSGQNIAAANNRIRAAAKSQQPPHAGMAPQSSRAIPQLISQLNYRCMIILFNGIFWYTTKAAKMSGTVGDRTWGKAVYEPTG
jgi:hypothetical protein